MKGSVSSTVNWGGYFFTHVEALTLRSDIDTRRSNYSTLTMPVPFMALLKYVAITKRMDVFPLCVCAGGG